MGKGTRRERELLNKFRDNGFGGLRAPSSGSSTDEDLPDILVSHELPDFPGWADPYAIEAKYRGAQDRAAKGNRKVYLNKEEVEALKRFADDFGATPLIFGRWSTRIEGVSEAVWWVFKPEDIPSTEESKRISYDEAELTFDEWLERRP